MKINIKKNNGNVLVNSEKAVLSLAFTGDLCPLNGYEKCFMEGSLNEMMPEIVTELNNTDVHITNLEAPLTERGKAILKCGPNFRAAPGCVNGLKQLNTSYACLANNHIKDFGQTGIEDTIKHLESSGIKALGIVKGEKAVMEASIFNKNGLRIGLLNVAEAEFSYPTDDSLGCSFIDEVEVIKRIQHLKDEVDIIIVISHAGREYKFFPANWLRKMYRNFIDAGAQAVIAHHPHVAQGIEVYNGNVIFYSLGNFVFDLAGQHEKLGPDISFFTKLNFSKNGVSGFKIYPYQRNDDNSISLLKNKKSELFLSFIDKISEPLADDKLAERIWNEYTRGDSDLYLSWLKKCLSNQPFNKTEESKAQLAYLFSVLSMSQTHKKMVESIFRLLFDDNIESDHEAAEIIKSWELILKNIQKQDLKCL